MPIELSHRGNPVQFGAEKELSMRNLPPNMDRFDETNPQRWAPQLTAFTADQLDPAARAKQADQLTWQDLNDAGKAAWITAYRAQFGKDPVIIVSPAAPDIDRIDWEHTGELEAVSDVFSDVGRLKSFLDEFGWGHITTSFMRGMPKEERNQMLTFTALANLYVFTHGLEARGADGRGEKGWRFTIKPLAVPTEEHLKVFDGMFDKNRTATAFSKHNQLAIRAGGKYGDKNRIALEVRGGDVEEKRRLQNAIFGSLNESRWGAAPFEWGSNGFRLVKLNVDVAGGDPQQVKSLPRDFETLVAQVPGVDATKAQRIFGLVAGAKFADAPAPARITQFDQRAAIPFLPWKELPFLDEGTRTRVVAAQQNLANKLDELSEKQLTPRAAAEQVSDAFVAWAQEARISEALGRWLDGPPERPAYL